MRWAIVALYLLPRALRFAPLSRRRLRCSCPRSRLHRSPSSPVFPPPLRRPPELTSPVPRSTLHFTKTKSEKQAATRRTHTRASVTLGWAHPSGLYAWPKTQRREIGSSVLIHPLAVALVLNQSSLHFHNPHVNPTGQGMFIVGNRAWTSLAFVC